MVACKRKNDLSNNFDRNLPKDRLYFISANLHVVTKYDHDNLRNEIPEMA